MPVIVGDVADPHVEAVVAQLHAEPVIVDASSLPAKRVTITGNEVHVDGLTVSPQAGWLRRLAPAGWTESMNDRGLEAAARSAAVSALAALARDERFDWLTPLDRLGGAENKPYQYRLAAAAGVPVPEWIVTTDPESVPTSGDWISKPLGPGSFIDEEGTGYVVPTTAVNLGDPQTIARVPFILQRRVKARVHARIITVGPHAWSATLRADDLPMDWRMAPSAHYGFTDKPVPDDVSQHALAITSATEVRYSAQDWIQGADGRWWFVDLNPAGQWLFLPATVAEPATLAIARHLEGRR